MRFISSSALAIGLLGIAASLSPSGAHAQSRAARDYVLLATDGINATGLTVRSGDVLVLDGAIASNRPLVAPSSRLAAPSLRLDGASVCSTLFASSLRGGGPACGTPHPFDRPFASAADACDFPDPFPACDPQRPPVVVPHGATVALPPGIYGDIRVEGGAGGPGTLRLAGTYGMCSLRLSRDAQVLFTTPSDLFVAGVVTSGTSARLAPAPGSGLSAQQVDVLVAGSLVRWTRRSTVDANVCAPSAALRVGSSATLTGRFVAANMRFRRDVVSLAVDGHPSTSTSTTTTTSSIASPTSTSTTTLAHVPQCGDGVVDPGEVCDGDVACTSPGGSFLTCSACAAFTSGPCETTTTTTLPGFTTPTTLPAAGRCGDGVRDPGEACDDGNTADCDGCSARCTTEAPGNGVLDCDEECDDDNLADCDGCDADGEIECGNGMIDAECGEVCDGDDVAGQSCADGVVTCAPDCRALDRSRCPTTAEAPQEICGNCIDDDLNGLVDFEDPACCGGSGTFSGALDKARLKPRRNGRTLLRLRGQLASPPTPMSAPDDVFLQVRTQEGAELVCASLPANHWKALRRTLRFRDRNHLVSSARALDLVRLRRTKRGALQIRAVGRSMRLDIPHTGTLQMTLGFVDPTGGSGANRCATMAAALRPARNGMRAP